jgi:hypothetical protein
MTQSERILKSAKALLDYKPSKAMGAWTMIKDKFIVEVIEYVEATETFVEDVESISVEEKKAIFDDLKK